MNKKVLVVLLSSLWVTINGCGGGAGGGGESTATDPGAATGSAGPVAGTAVPTAEPQPGGAVAAATLPQKPGDTVATAPVPDKPGDPAPATSAATASSGTATTTPASTPATTTATTTPTTTTTATDTTTATATIAASTTTATTNLSACANPSGGYEGFGNSTTGGAGQAVVHVTNLNDSGTGSLRAALSGGNRCVVFDVAGTINLSADLPVRGANVTVDGFTAPSPGITLKGRTFLIDGAYGAANVIARGIRVRTAGDDTIRVYNAQNVVIDHVSVSDFGDGGIDVTQNARNVTISWTIFGIGTGMDQAGKDLASLNKYAATRITHHHNLYYYNNDRTPFCGWQDSDWSTTHDLVCDVRNNLIWGLYWYGTSIRQGGTANVINNYYWARSGGTPSHSVYIAEGGLAYTSGNYSKNGANVNNGNASTAFSASAPATTDAMTAARAVLAGAGARGAKFGLDSTDQGYISTISP